MKALLRSSSHLAISVYCILATASILAPIGESVAAETTEPDCYTSSDNGFTYRGNVDVTIDNQKCINWADALHCPHNPYKYQDMSAGLDGNFCRNPGDGSKPWCYVSADGCQREDCDVCNAVSNQPKASSVTCTKPPKMWDSYQVDKTDQDTFTVGESVTFVCRRCPPIAKTTLKKYCLSNGKWSHGKTACLPCHKDKGYVLYKDVCYKILTERKTANQQQRECRRMKGNLADVKSLDEQEFITKLGAQYGVSDLYIGANDIKNEGSFRFRDNSDVSWAPWAMSNLNGPNKDCVISTSNNQWSSTACGEAKPAVCKTRLIHHSRRTHGALCRDSREDCADMLSNDPSMCQREGRSFGLTECPKTCGECHYFVFYI